MVLQISRDDSIAVTATSTQIANDIQGSGFKRVSLAVTNTSAATIITISFGDNSAQANKGIRLSPGAAYGESNSDNFNCWQGAIQAIGDGAGTLSLSERQESK